MVTDGAVGELRHVRAALTVRIAERDIRRERALGGGALGDLGCYCVSAARLFAGNPERVFAEAVSEEFGVETHVSATMRHPNGVLASFDVGFDLPRRDELELIGTEGKLVITDPWLCRASTVAVHRDGSRHDLPVDPRGRFGLTQDDLDVYRIEIDAISATIADGAPPAFGRADAIEQARVLESLTESIDHCRPVTMAVGPRPTRPPTAVG